MLTFHGNHELRAELLDAMAQHAEQGVFGDVPLAGRQVQLYRIGRHSDGAAIAEVLGLPVSMLELGFYLFDGFPETRSERQAFITLRRRMLAAFPVGVDCSSAAGWFCYRLLKEERFGIAALIHSAESAALRREVMGAIDVDPNGAFLDDDLRQRVRQARAAQATANMLHWKAERREDQAGIKTLRALDTLEAICRLPIDDHAVADAAEQSVYGANGINAQPSDTHEEALRSLFIQVMRR